jgi:hypothetical protein
VSTSGGALSAEAGATPVMVNCTVALNSCGSNGTGSGVKSIDSISNVGLISCIVVSNFPADTQLATSTPGTLLTTDYCDLPVQQQAEYGFNPNNLFVDPLFVNLASGDLHLKPQSPCKNTGSTTFIRGALDIDGQVRVWGPRVDIGADELKYKILQAP